jgi:putative Holliday junction resolvase
MSGAEGPQAKEVRTAALELARALALPLEFWDERLTTVIAERSLISGGRSRQQRREEIDAVAAAVMLQGFLDRRAVHLRTAGEGDSAILAEVMHPDDLDGE